MKGVELIRLPSSHGDGVRALREALGLSLADAKALHEYARDRLPVPLVIGVDAARADALLQILARAGAEGRVIDDAGEHPMVLSLSAQRSPATGLAKLVSSFGM